MRQPGVESTCPLIAGLSCGKSGWYTVSRVARMSRTSQAGVTCNAAERFEFVKAAAELEKGADQADRASPSRESWCHVQPQPNTTQADDRTVSAPGPSLP